MPDRGFVKTFHAPVKVLGCVNYLLPRAAQTSLLGVCDLWVTASGPYRLANARDQLSGYRASGRAEDARALLRQIYNTEGPVSRRPKQNLGRAPAPSDAGGE